ncbi:MAG: hypothetical protein AUI04_08335 [Candidatus Rokubacteria bacterium 13_2_20CM_2_64_8]|nr:MAG: hypothetical protein AUI04_08335 [Candidatus Rokubacteria bacterium 13_2_20CM_2_64_8]
MVDLRAGLRRVDTPLARSLLLGVAVSIAVTVVSRFGGLAGWETRAIDAFLFFRDRVPTPEIVLVNIDDAAFQEMGERQPLPRPYLAQLAEFLLESGARVVGFDVQLKKATTPREDGALVAVTRRWDGRSGRLVFTTVANPIEDVRPARYAPTPAYSPDLRAIFGFANAPLSPDGLVRVARPVLPAAGDQYLPSFALAVLAGYEGYSPEALAAALTGGTSREVVLPVGDPKRGINRHDAISVGSLRDTVWRIDYVGQPGAFAAARRWA